MKEFTITEGNGQEVKLTFKKPDFATQEESDKIYASKIAGLVRESGKKKLLLRQELDNFLRSNDIWTIEDEQKITDINKNIESTLNKLRKGGIKLSEGRKLAIEITDKRKEMLRIMNKKRVLDSSTVESVAEDEKIDYIIYSCTVYADDEDRNYWESFEDMKNDKRSEVYAKAYYASTEVIYGVDEDFDKKLPENRWLSKYGFLDKELRFIDRKSGEHVDREGNTLTEKEEEIKQQTDNLQGEIVEEVPFIED